MQKSGKKEQDREGEQTNPCSLYSFGHLYLQHLSNRLSFWRAPDLAWASTDAQNSKLEGNAKLK